MENLKRLSVDGVTFVEIFLSKRAHRTLYKVSRPGFNGHDKAPFAGQHESFGPIS